MPKKNLTALLAERAAIDARIKLCESRQKQQERKNDTRRKILLGGLLARWMREQPNLERRVFGTLDQQLSRDVDRSLFDFRPRESSAVEPV